MSTAVIAYVDDLMFVSRIREAARPLALEIQTARSASQLLEACRSGSPKLVLADLDSPRLGSVEAIRALRAEPQTASVPVIGFVSHVNGALVAEAQAAGCTRVLARGAFVQELPRLLESAAS